MKIVVYREGAEEWRSAIETACPSARVVTYRDRDPLDDVEDAEALVGWRFPDLLLKAMPKLTWLQLVCVGAHDVARSPWIRPHVTITNTRGIYADSVADYVIWALLTLARGFHRVLANQRWGRWRQVTAQGLGGKTLVVVGLGQVGAAVASRAVALGMRVVGVTRTPRPAVPDGVEQIVPYDGCADVVSSADAVALCAPFTEQTRGFLHARVIERLKFGALVINIGAAELVDLQALVRALRAGALGGAALDVLPQEPLSRFSPLWRVPNLLVTPHLSALTTDYRARVKRLLSDNVGRFQTGRPLLNVVDRSHGY